MSINPFIVSAVVVAMVMIVTITMLMRMSKPEKEQDDSKQTLENIDQTSS